MHDNDESRDDDIDGWLHRFAGWLPDQGPLQVFVHHNPLHHFEGRPFHDACEAAARLFGARSTFTAAHYRQLIREGRIAKGDVAPKRTTTPIDLVPPPPPSTLLMSSVAGHLAVEVKEMADAAMLRVLPVFIDEGSARWPLPGRDQGFLEVTRQLARTRFGFTELWLQTLDEVLAEGTAKVVMQRCLQQRCADPTGWPSVLKEAVFATPGYAGMMARKGALSEFVAVRLAIEECALKDVARRLFGTFASLQILAVAAGPAESLQSVWNEELASYQDAYEEHYVRVLMSSLAATQSLPREPNVQAQVQMIGCIDDRLESFRRHFEECVPASETFGFAGFFGVAIKHRAPLTSDETPSCPAPVTPTKRVTEQLSEADVKTEERRRFWARLWDGLSGGAGARGLLGGLLASLVGIVLTPLTLVQIFFPSLLARRVRAFEGTKLLLSNQDDVEGFSIEERANSVNNLLESLALHDKLAPLVLILGHGSKSMNNPFLSAYQCGACGGQRGGINARTFCNFANDRDVRANLAARGVNISDATVFVAGEFDTSLDFFRWFDLETMNAEQRQRYDALLPQLEEVSKRNAKERARRFLNVPLDVSEARALKRVRARASDLAEPRPEYNHATVAACLVGPRELTRGLFLDRRAFLVSYDPKYDDPTGKILQRMLTAPVPVSAGISLEYYFSTMDPVNFGAGTKLPHNVQGLIGVSNGAGGDLRPGLWTQTTEIHEPVRLVTVIYQEPELLTSCIEKVPEVHRYVLNDWVHMFAWSPSGRGFFRWKGTGFVPYQTEARVLPKVSSSLAACAGTRANAQPMWVHS